MSALITHDRSTPVTGSLLPYVETPAPAPLQTQQVAGELKDKNGGVSSQGVQLPAPLAVVASQVTEGQQQEVTKLLESVTRGAAGSQLISNYVSVLTKFTLASPDTFEIELGKLVSNLEEVRKDIKIADIQRLHEQNMKKIEENQEKIKETEENAKQVKKSGIASKIFGWLSAIASVIVGAIMVASGVGAVAGAMMVASGVIGMANMAVKQAAEDGLISQEAMKILGPILTAIEVALTVVSTVMTFGGSALKCLANIGAKLGANTASLAAKGAEFSAKVAQISTGISNTVGSAVTKLGGSFAGLTMSHAIRTGSQATQVAVGVGSGITQTINNKKQADLQHNNADLALNKADMAALQSIIDRLKEELSHLSESHQQVMELIFQMINAKGDMLHNLAGRPHTV
ncbi:protein yopB (plasmid) [Yersinia pseudotuberculosis IP 32953]|uniref:Type 3 secretion system translocon protein SctE n=6 Tax=Yersinia pseudotuberculosis complex TaxID=1649845 RepID=SCTE_YERPS|nr:type III secretion system translocon subunit YopB [Yersinia pseudotuberculosis]Q06114.1 RecName: Full=Type 3 secretion system translocon protein SctE; Short=T3SS translocon protein SctE; AltName: Full=Yersinia outer protein B [Yersinia pseudotuberculosis IP 32953]CQD58680.1 virulence plasmid YopB transmembrane effector protein [Yersinia intermedia]AAA72321.1 yopB [Yersinia pseudotuberculosis]AJJ04943.1 protein yopB [Yersinia pseudotuberculosis]AJJ53127.1 protein yopB [Yersinia pseudotubercu